VKPKNDRSSNLFSDDWWEGAQRLMELEMQRGMSAQIEALKAQITELKSSTPRRPEQKGLPSPPRTVPNPTDSLLRYQETPPLETVTQDMLRCSDAPAKNTQAGWYSLTQEMRRGFSTTGSDHMKVKELMERKQGPHETFSDCLGYAQLAFQA